MKLSTKKLQLVIGGMFFTLMLYSQQGFVHEQSDGYVWPQEASVLKKLDSWQDLKFGVLFHWGLYSVPGIVESWSICSEDVDWIPRDSTVNYEAYKRWYWGLKDQFNPVDFDPEQWSQIMSNFLPCHINSSESMSYRIYGFEVQRSRTGAE